MTDVKEVKRKAIEITKQKSLKCFNPLNFIYMKIILSMVLLLFFTFQLSAQITIQNTKWKGRVVRGANTNEIVFDFKKDTLYNYRNGTELISTFAFSQSHDTLTVTKTGGTGPCPMNSKGTYRIESLENDARFYLRLINEECPGRATGWITNPFEKIN